MNIGTIGPQQLKSLVEDKWQRDEQAPAVGLHVTSGWRGPDEVAFDKWKATVVRADTVFQVRAALCSAERQKRRIILLTKLEQRELGQDVVARFARSRLFPIDHWASLCALFRAKELDRSICEPAVAQALLEYAPSDGYPPVPAGVLDAGTVWKAVCRHVFEMGEREPDLVSLLVWATTNVGPAHYLAAGDELKAGLRQRLVTVLGNAADSVLRFVEAGAGPDALALAAACQVIFGDGSEPILDAAAARMEQYHGNKAISKGVGLSIGQTAADAVADLDRREEHRIVQHHTQRADEYLRQFRCDDHAHRSRLTLSGFEGRLARFGLRVQSALDIGDKAEFSLCEERLAEVGVHRLARTGRYQERASQAEMAMRLVRWLEQPLPSSPNFAELASAYVREISFVDWARESVCRGDDISDLSEAYRRLDRAVLGRRSQFSRAFANALADWTAVGSKGTSICGVEDLLEQVVAKAAQADNRVLLIVLDGMSWAVCHEMLDDIRGEYWAEATLDKSMVPLHPVIATIPSVTAISRTSLLTGKLTNGDASTEKRNFEANLSLRQICDKRYPPVLFHKKEVTEGGRGALADDFTKVVLSQHHRVVGVVINAIDDRLANAPQIRDNWSINRIGPLGVILKLARDSGRVVVLASDHGHIWHRTDARTLPSEKGSRWRPSQGVPADGELVISGARVRSEANGQSVIAAWEETIHYGRPQNGYHGGASPQEMICPLVLLWDRTSPGLFPCEYPKPEWWSKPPTASAVVIEPAGTVSIPKGPANLFEHVDVDTVTPVSTVLATELPVPSSDWIGGLLASPLYKAQKDMIRRHAPDDDLVRTSLEALNAVGGIMTPVAFAKAADLPAARLDGFVAQMQRLLNMDGYEILTLNRNENRVEFNVVKLKRQFDLE